MELLPREVHNVCVAHLLAWERIALGQTCRALRHVTQGLKYGYFDQVKNKHYMQLQLIDKYESSPQKAKRVGKVRLQLERLVKVSGVKEAFRTELATWLQEDAANLQVKVMHAHAQRVLRYKHTINIWNNGTSFAKPSPRTDAVNAHIGRLFGTEQPIEALQMNELNIEVKCKNEQIYIEISLADEDVEE